MVGLANSNLGSLDATGVVKGVLGHIGTVRSEVLVFSIICFILLETFAAVTTLQNSGDMSASVMRYAGVVILFLGGGFYIYALCFLPSSIQELIFAKQSLPEIEKTKLAVQESRAQSE